MAKLRSGILGGISGTVGNVVGGRWRGIDYIRSKPSSVRNPNTEAQRNQRMRFRLVIQLLKKIRPLVNIGFGGYSQNQTPMNQAMSLNIRDAVTGEYPDLSIDPEKLVFSAGELANADNTGMDATEPGQVTVSWSYSTGTGQASPDDGALLLLYNIDRDAVQYSIHGSAREDEEAVLQIPESWQGEQIAGYLAFRSATSQQHSASRFISIETAAETT
jgi:hypothetical protein